MSETPTNCTHNCETCGQACSSREGGAPDFREAPHELSSIKKVIGIVSGKGGVGKSLVTSLLAVSMQRAGRHVGILDADITGPSIPKVFGVHEKATGTDKAIFPVQTQGGMDIMSINLLLEDETAPVVWRGPVIAGAVKQFWTDVVWKDIDFLFVDMPPGTGDVPLTVFQSLPLDGIIVVTSPQELVSMIVGKAVNMAKMMNIPILGIVENMSYVQCPHCDERIAVYGDSHIDAIAAEYGLQVLGKLPIDPALARACDEGVLESLQGDYLSGAAALLQQLP